MERTGHCLFVPWARFAQSVVRCLQQPLLANSEIKAFIILCRYIKPSEHCFRRLKLVFEMMIFLKAKDYFFFSDDGSNGFQRNPPGQWQNTLRLNFCTLFYSYGLLQARESLLKSMRLYTGGTGKPQVNLTLHEWQWLGFSASSHGRRKGDISFWK